MEEKRKQKKVTVQTLEQAIEFSNSYVSSLSEGAFINDYKDSNDNLIGYKVIPKGFVKSENVIIYTVRKPTIK